MLVSRDTEDNFVHETTTVDISESLNDAPKIFKNEKKNHLQVYELKYSKNLSIPP
jgi:hypothetical protein